MRNELNDNLEEQSVKDTVNVRSALRTFTKKYRNSNGC